MFATTPSGSCVIRSSSFCAASTNTFCSRSARADSAMKKSSRPISPFNSLRDWRMGLPTSCVSVLASASVRAMMSSRNFSIAAMRRRIGVAAQRGCAARAAA
jgi:hypothetical protein